MTILLIEMLILLLCAATAWYFFYRLVPEIGKQVTLVMLHNKRDYLYNLREENPVWEKSLVYRDMEFGITNLIYIIRELPKSTSIFTVIEMIRWRLEAGSNTPQNPDGSDWRSNRYAYEKKHLFRSKKNRDELRNALTMYFEKDVVICLFLFTAHPFLFIPTLVFIPISIFVFPAIHYIRILPELIDRLLDKIMNPIVFRTAIFVLPIIFFSVGSRQKKDASLLEKTFDLMLESDTKHQLDPSFG